MLRRKHISRNNISVRNGYLHNYKLIPVYKKIISDRRKHLIAQFF